MARRPFISTSILGRIAAQCAPLTQKGREIAQGPTEIDHIVIHGRPNLSGLGKHLATAPPRAPPEPCLLKSLKPSSAQPRRQSAIQPLPPPLPFHPPKGARKTTLQARRLQPVSLFDRHRGPCDSNGNAHKATLRATIP